MGQSQTGDAERVRVPGRLSYYAVTTGQYGDSVGAKSKYLSHFLSREYL
jgi:hypothetical protein